MIDELVATQPKSGFVENFRGMRGESVGRSEIMRLDCELYDAELAITCVCCANRNAEWIGIVDLMIEWTPNGYRP